MAVTTANFLQYFFHLATIIMDVKAMLVVVKPC
jgi:hypothetical protein